ncbi:histidine kinase [Kytococcus schroeteri]|uniref:histidine kinase n=1 Tax=Kytococcus schroeteri TaxID=138300 RepID=A0A2I1PBR2_9MICO|nr:ATP-binding protein [Kytococcus schroeteri]PKZ42064.1 histidine kinase [Kytococcus schroeteri]
MSQGRLRIRLGAAPGVGKTCAMLDEGHALAADGVDVVIGYLEDHDRPATRRRAEGLEVVPRRRTVHRGVAVEEMDLQAVLDRRPEVALVDELAHTNAPGSENAKRWQDVRALLEAGIDVISTVNIQHLESLNDTVTAITGVVQRETVPDAQVRAADRVELVDLSPEALRARLTDGLVYRPERVDSALQNYFRPGNLAALRELALLWLADRVNEGLAAYRIEHGIDGTWPTRDRVVVAVSGGREGSTLLRRGARIAGRSAGGAFHAVHVAPMDGLTVSSPGAVAGLRQLTEELGGTFHTVTGRDPAEGVLEFARGVNAAQVVVGSSRRPWWRRAVDAGTSEKIIRDSGEIDVHVVTHALAGRGGLSRPVADLPAEQVRWGWVLAVLLPLLLTPPMTLLPSGGALPLIVQVYLLVTVVVALAGGLWPAVASAVICSALLNWYFTPPVHEWTISDPQNVAAIVVYVLIAGLVAGVVHARARRAQAAVRAQQVSHSLAALAPTVLGSADPMGTLLRQAVELLGLRRVSLVRLEEGSPPVVEASADATDGPADTASEPPAGTAEGAETLREPVGDGHQLVLVTDRPLEAMQRRVVSALAVHAEAVVQRRALEAEARTADELARDNRARRALLSAVSHDLRTPLAAIKASIGSLRSTEVDFAPEDREELQEIIEHSSDRLEALVDNLLDMSRLQFGAVVATLRPVDLAETVHSALEGEEGATAVECDFDPAARVVLADPGLLERVLGNLLENALRHQPAGEPVRLRSRRVEGDDADPSGASVVLELADTGVGVAADQRARMFEPFQRLGDVPAGNGVGLGLAVARGLVTEMGGTLEAAPTPGGGLTMLVTLPAPDPGVDHSSPGAPCAVAGASPAAEVPEEGDA